LKLLINEGSSLNNLEIENETLELQLILKTELRIAIFKFNN
jgi:hypothetical protein